MRISKLVILIFGICFSQSNVNFFISDELKVLDSLNRLLDNDKNLTGSYKLVSYKYLNNKINYEYHNEKKIVDTVIVSGLGYINTKIIEKIIKPYKITALGTEYDKIGTEISSQNYFINKKPTYNLGITDNNMLAALISIDSDFYSHFSGNIGLRKKNNLYNLNGEINIHLENLLKSAGIIDFYWKKNDTLTQVITFNLYEPFLMNSSLGTDFSYYRGLFNGLYIKLEKRLKFELLSYNYFHYSVGFLKGSTDPTKNGILNNYGKVKYEAFSISFNKNLLNNRFLPTQGNLILFETDIGISNKAIYANTLFNYNKYILINNLFYWNLIVNSEGVNILNSKVPMSRYKKFGGYSTLRGYDDNQFESTQFSISTLEFNYILNLNSHPFLFLDIASTKINVFNNNMIGYGFGLKKDNDNLSLNISYAFSKQKTLFSEGALHIKVISKF
ncbi:MAG: hypothetical protein ACJZ14_06980 [Candidatus Neomarinimicrobiota bacterium]